MLLNCFKFVTKYCGSAQCHIMELPAKGQQPMSNCYNGYMVNNNKKYGSAKLVQTKLQPQFLLSCRTRPRRRRTRRRCECCACELSTSLMNHTPEQFFLAGIKLSFNISFLKNQAVSTFRFVQVYVYLCLSVQFHLTCLAFSLQMETIYGFHSKKMSVNSFW